MSVICILVNICNYIALKTLSCIFPPSTFCDDCPLGHFIPTAYRIILTGQALFLADTRVLLLRHYFPWGCFPSQGNLLMVTIVLMSVNGIFCFSVMLFSFIHKTFQDKLFVAPKLPTFLPVPGGLGDESVFPNSSFVWSRGWKRERIMCLILVQQFWATVQI